MGAILLGKYTVLLVWVCILQIILHYFLQKTFVCKNGALETIPMPRLFCNLIDTLPTSHYLMKLMQKTSWCLQQSFGWVCFTLAHKMWHDCPRMLMAWFVAHYKKLFPSLSIVNSLLLLLLCTWGIFCMPPPSSWQMPMQKLTPLHGTIQMNIWIVQLLAIGICPQLSRPVSLWTKTCVSSAFPIFNNNLNTGSDWKQLEQQQMPTDILNTSRAAQTTMCNTRKKN